MRNYLMLLLLFAVIIGITLLYMTEDPKPTASMLGDSVIKAEVKKEVKKEYQDEPLSALLQVQRRY